LTFVEPPCTQLNQPEKTIESLGPINITRMESLQDLGQRMTEATGDPVKRHTSFNGCLSARSALTFHSITVMHSHMAAICRRQRCLVLPGKYNEIN